MKVAKNRLRSLALLFVVAFATSLSASAHCDTMNGPVVTDARRALDTGNVLTILKWVRPEHDVEVRRAFAQTVAVRAQGGDSRELADRFFFETFVRLHRLGEGEPYTGLKDSAEIEHATTAVDEALETGTINLLLDHFDRRHADGIRPRFIRAVQTKQHADDTSAAGREYVAAYVDLIHYVHGLQEAEKREHGHSQSETPEATTIQIQQFSASTTRLKKNGQAKLLLAFHVEPAGAKVNWRLTCDGVAIAGWDSKQVLSISERTAGGDIQTIEGHGFIGTNPAVAITVKRPKSSPANKPASCTAALQGLSSEEAKKTIPFELQ